MLDNFVLALVVGLRHAVLAVQVADLVLGVRKVALLPLLLRPLVSEIAAQVILQLIIHLISPTLHAIRAYEREVGLRALCPFLLL